MQNPSPRFDTPAAIARLKEVARQLPAEQAATRKAGLPLTGEELRARTRIPDRDNAAPLYRKLTATRDAAETRRVADALQSRNFADSKAALTRNRERIALLNQALARPGCDFARHWEEGTSVTFPELATLRDAARLLALQARVHAIENRPLDALATLTRSGRLLRHAFAEPILIGLLVGLAVDAILNRAFETVLQSQADQQPGIRQRAAAAARALEAPSNLRLCLGAEAMMVHETLRALRAGQKKEDIPVPPAASREFFDANEAQILHNHRALLAHPMRTEAELRALQAWDAADAARDVPRADKDPSLFLWVVFRPALGSIVGRVIEREERIRSRRKLA